MIARRSVLGVASLACAALTLTGCNLDPRTTTLPGGIATGDDGYTVTAVFTSADNLVPNSDVQYNNVRIGTVRGIDLDRTTWTARVRLSLRKDINLPANVVAAVGQKSLLGAEFVQLSKPAVPSGRLVDNSVIPLSATSRYPDTEQVLSAVSLLLNDGGLSQLKTITTEVDAALSGRTATARDVLDQLAVFSTQLDQQKTHIVDAMDALNSLAGQLAAQRDVVSRALTHITPAVTTLNQDKGSLTKALAALDRLSVLATDVLNRNKNGLAINLAQLRPVLTKLVEAGKGLPDSLPIFVSFPFPLTTLDKAVKGDYMNLFVTSDVSLQAIQADFLAQIPIVGGLPLSTIGDAKNPLLAPLGGLIPPGSKSKPGSSGAQSPGTTPPASTPTPTPTPTPTTSPGCTLVKAVLGQC